MTIPSCMRHIHSIDNELIKYIQRLQEENAKLKKTFHKGIRMMGVTFDIIADKRSQD